MHQQQQQPTMRQPNQRPPHHSHSDPWALNFICCDAPHAASTSIPSSTSASSHTPNGNGTYSGSFSNPGSTVTSPINSNFSHTHPVFPSPLATTTTASNHSPAEVNRRSGTESCNGPNCSSVECCTDPTCGTGVDRGRAHADVDGMDIHYAPQDGIGGLGGIGEGSDELMKWACSKEGCEAIQQYLECCTQPNCQLPTVPPPSLSTHTQAPSYTSSASASAHYHMLNPDLMNSMVSGLGNGLQAPFHHIHTNHSASDPSARRQSSLSIFDEGVDPVNLQHLSRPSSSSSRFLPSSHNNSGHFHSGHTHNSQNQHTSHLPQHNIHHQQLHDHSHSHSHSHRHTPSLSHIHTSNHSPRSNIQSPHSHLSHPLHQGSSFQTHRQRHSHSHSTSISSLPQSSLPSPDILPWSNPPHSTAQTPTSTSSSHTPILSATSHMAPVTFPTHICHWSNCHLTFSSMPDLLGHVAADHLGAPGFGPSNPLPPQSPALFIPHSNTHPSTSNTHSHSRSHSTQTQRQITLQPTSQAQAHHQLQSLSSLSSSSSGSASDLIRHFNTPFPPSSSSTPNSSSGIGTGVIPSLSALGFNPSPNSQAEQDRLLSCLWDDCFPLPTECSADEPDQCPPHTHIPAPADCTVSHPHSHTHTHRNTSGEPFSPQTMLRHVLEEHLGVPSDILGWDVRDAEFGLEALAAGLAVGRPNGGVGKGAGLGVGELQLPPPTLESESRRPSGTPILSPPSAPSPPSPKPLICHWHLCSHAEPFANPSELMDHLSEVHVGRGKDSYSCLWGDCACSTEVEVEVDEDDASGSGVSMGEGSGGGSGEMKNHGPVQGRLFRSRQKVLRHLQSHTGYRPFICHVCQQAFSEAAPLAAHIRRHNEEKPFCCEVEGCGKRFAISSSLTIHMRTHNGDKPFICPHCQKGFVEASNLTKHIRTHTGERPFACLHPGCGKRFPRPDQLKRHVAIHDKERERVKAGGAGAGGAGGGKVGAGKSRGKGKV